MDKEIMPQITETGYYNSVAQTGKGVSAFDNYWDSLKLDQRIAWYLVILVILLVMFKPKGGKH